MVTLISVTSALHFVHSHSRTPVCCFRSWLKKVSHKRWAVINEGDKNLTIKLVSQIFISLTWGSHCRLWSVTKYSVIRLSDMKVSQLKMSQIRVKLIFAPCKILKRPQITWDIFGGRRICCHSQDTARHDPWQFHPHNNVKGTSINQEQSLMICTLYNLSLSMKE